MRSRWNLLIVLIYMGIALTGLTFMAAQMSGPCQLGEWGVPGYQKCVTLKIQFKNASGLLHSNDLRMDGVKVGEVTSVDVEQDIAVITARLRPQYGPVHVDAHAIVRPKNLLGETYVELDKGTSGAREAKSGDTIPLAQTLTPVQVDELLNALDADTRTKLQIVINGLGEATAQRGQDMNLSAQDLRRIAASVATTSTTLDQQKQDIDSLLVQLDLIQQTVADYHGQLAKSLQDWNDVSLSMQHHDQALADSLSHLDNVLATLDAGLTPNTPALTNAVANLPSTIDHANDFLGISDAITQAFITPPPGRPGTQAPIRDGIAIFPRLAQVMLGVNSCDDHIYANGYRNTPGTTEPATCPTPGVGTDPTLRGEVFSGLSGSSTNKYGQVSQNRHLWRVMGMIDITGGQLGTGSITCGLLTPSSAPETDRLHRPTSACYPGSTGLEPYQDLKPAPGLASASSSNGIAGFFSNLWTDLVGGGRA